jgi:hypothetical protein
MMATAPEDVIERFEVLLADDRSAEVIRAGLGYLQRLFGASSIIAIGARVHRCPRTYYPRPQWDDDVSIL